MDDLEPGTAVLERKTLEAFEPAHVGAAISKLFAASIGDLAVVLSRSPVHKYFSLADIEWMILPPVTVGQFYVVEAAHKERGFRAPIAVATWAFVSEEVDRRLQEQAGKHIRLRPDEWTSGKIGWLVDLVGGPAEVRSILRWLASGHFKDRPLKLVVRDESGGPRVITLDRIASQGSDGEITG